MAGPGLARVCRVLHGRIRDQGPQISDRPTVTARPGVAIWAKSVDTRHEIPGHADIAIPNEIETYVADLGKEALEARGDVRFEPTGAMR